MEMSRLRKILKNDMECYPFNGKYSNDSLTKSVFEKFSNEELAKDNLTQTLMVVPFMNDHFIEYYEYLKENIIASGIKYDELVELLFTLFNRNFLGLTKKGMSDSNANKEFHQKDFYSHKIQTIDPTMQKVEAASALEAEVDAMALVLSYLRYFKNDDIEKKENNELIHPIKIAQRIAFSGAFYSIVKEEYDNSIWNNGYWVYSDKGAKKIMNVIFNNTEILIINKVGLLRMQKNSSSNFLGIMHDVENETPYGVFILGMMKLKKKHRRIKKVWIENSCIQYKLAKGYGKRETFSEIKNVTDFITFYSFLSDIKLPNLPDLEPIDLIRLFSLLQDLLRECATYEFDDSIYSVEDIKKFPNKISLDSLVDYLYQRSEYSNKQIRAFIDLISENFGNRLNLWDRPLVKYNGDIYISYLSTLAPITLNLIDFWIEKGGFSLDERGKLLENYLTKNLGALLFEKGFWYKMPESHRFYDGKGGYEEIDLVINLKSVVLIAEVKCIKYPLDTRDKHNGMNRIEKGVVQAKRKLKFLENNRKHFEGQIGDYEGKELVPIVITNYPIYSGYSIDDVAIVDFYLLEGYFGSGKMSDVRMERKGVSQEYNLQYYYRNEDQMNKNLRSFCKHPLPVEELKEIFEIRNFRITVDNLPYEINVTSAQIKDNYNVSK